MRLRTFYVTRFVLITCCIAFLLTICQEFYNYYSSHDSIAVEMIVSILALSCVAVPLYAFAGRLKSKLNEPAASGELLELWPLAVVIGFLGLLAGIWILMILIFGFGRFDGIVN